jgi:chromosome segregation ATPase
MQALSDEQQMDRLEKKVDRMDQRFDRLEMKLDRNFERIDQKFEGVDAKLDRVRGEARSDHRTLLPILYGVWATVIFGLAGILIQLH